MKRVENITVDVKKIEYDEIKLKQMDTTQIVFKVLDNSKEIDLTGTQARLIFTKPNQNIVIQNATINEDQKSITADLKADCVRSYGRGKIEVEILKDDEVLSSFYLNVQIEKTSKGNMNSDNTPNYFEQLEDSLNNFKKESTALLDTIEEEEEERVSAENNRVESEEKRITQEQKRVEAEQKRAESEQDREEAEKLRSEAELEREKNQTILKHTVPITELIPKETEYTLPCNYKVGNHSLRVHWENVLLEEGENGNYMEIGDKDSTSNKIKFGWDIEPGETLIIEVRGVVDE